MAIGKILKWLVAPKPVYPDQQKRSEPTEYGQKRADRGWYKVAGTFPIKYSGEPEYAIVGKHIDNPQSKAS
jgi:hypothetical protein